VLLQPLLMALVIFDVTFSLLPCFISPSRPSQSDQAAKAHIARAAHFFFFCVVMDFTEYYYQYFRVKSK
jgi:hypothetical protein